MNLKFIPQSPEDRIGEEVTKSLKRMLETMKIEVERSATNISTARSTTKNLNETSENYKNLSGTLDESRSLIRDLWRKNRNDMIYIFGALGIFLATAIWVIMQRIPGVILIPGKFVINQLKHMNPMKRSPTGIIVNTNEDSLSVSSNENEMFIDTIPKRKDSAAVEDEILFNVDEMKKEIESENKIKIQTVDSLTEDSTIESSSKESESIDVNSKESPESVENIKQAKDIKLNDNAKIVELPESIERLESEPINTLDLDSLHVNKENEDVSVNVDSDNDNDNDNSRAPNPTKTETETTTTSTVQNLPAETATFTDEHGPIKNNVIENVAVAITSTSNEFTIEEIVEPAAKEVDINSDKLQNAQLQNNNPSATEANNIKKMKISNNLIPENNNNDNDHSQNDSHSNSSNSLSERDEFDL